ncbi:MAG: MoaD/ThiS family protein [Chloroflexi bacterium]|nr:MoaD/ThiS family protein [Chloroflexota bacterium]
MPVVWLPSLLRPFAGGQRQIRVTGATIREALQSLKEQFPELGDRVWDSESLRPGLAVAVNGAAVSFGLAQPVAEEDELEIIPAIGGGADAHCVVRYLTHAKGTVRSSFGELLHCRTLYSATLR